MTFDRVCALAARRRPRYAIREAVHAVESVARVLTGNPKATISDALGVLKKEERIHPALEAAFQKLYAYTSDEHGLRHALNKEEADVDEPDAMYMVGSCAAFVTYLIGKARKYRLLPFERESRRARPAVAYLSGKFLVTASSLANICANSGSRMARTSARRSTSGSFRFGIWTSKFVCSQPVAPAIVRGRSGRRRPSTPGSSR
jgi:hypothetical protein